MKFTVCIKQVPDVYAPLQIKNGELSMDTDRMVLNAYDASAVEEALVLTEQHGGDVEVVLIGPDKAKETIRKALAMGAAKGHHIHVEDTHGLDSAAYASILTAFFEKNPTEVIATGKQSQDTDSGLAGSMIAASLNLPYAANAVGLHIDGGSSLVVKRQGDTGQEMLALPIPCLVTCSNDMNNPRIPSLKGIMASKKKPVETHTLEDLGLSLATVRDSVKTSTISYQEMPAREAGKKLEGDAEELVSSLMNLLQNEAKVI
ncbi:MAG: electron transfer flavoprotein subunit beta/FixA family protein [Bacteroidetes bacterium]|nr:electron transfer flavoprotein subunit beta/FixA family protein [Bacteroidota bacterium]MCH8523362.1 electron transfer flavoprotein subunit beta/FixA family protein [Balneolales bacterium]